MKTDSSIAAIYGLDQKTRVVRPLFACHVSAGFPSPADDYIDRRLDLNELLITNPAATFFVRAAGDSMIGAGINHDDVLIVDRSLTATSGKIVIAVLNGELTVKRLMQNDLSCKLVAKTRPTLPWRSTKNPIFRSGGWSLRLSINFNNPARPEDAGMVILQAGNYTS